MSRHERKMARNARLANSALLDHQIKSDLERRRAEFAAKHPILSGAVPLVDYQPPCGRYVAGGAA